MKSLFICFYHQRLRGITQTAFTRRILPAAVILGLLVSGWGGAPGLVMAQTELTVCASGCAYTTVQEAVDAAAPGDVVEIAAGEYTGVISRDGAVQLAYLTKDLTLRGGFNASFTTWDPALYPTTLNAQGGGRVIYASGPIRVTVDGLRLLNGYHPNAGGGIYVETASLRLLNAIVQAGRVSVGNGAGLYQTGGSLYMRDSTVRDSQPTNGGGGTGGGIYTAGAVVEIRDSQIANNTAAFGGYLDLGRGGGIFLDNSTSLLQGVTFANNLASTGTKGRGGGLGTSGGSLELLDCVFTDNAAAQTDGGAGGGAYLRTLNALVSGNEFTNNSASRAANPTGSGGGLDIGNSWESTTSIYGVTVSGNLLQNNIASDGGGLVAKTAVDLTIKDNRFIANHNSGLSVLAKSDTGAPTKVTLSGNLFQDNYTSGLGGGAVIFGAVDVLYNQFLNNRAGSGGGIYQGEISRTDNASAIYNGNLLRGNSAAEGGGLYLRPEYSPNLNITYRNLVLLDNTATTTGSGILFRRYTNAPVSFSHLTLSGNQGGDGAMVYSVMGVVSFNNSILSNAAVGIKKNSGTITLDHVLRYGLTTLSVGTLTDNSPVSGDPAFKNDGYHLTWASAAKDAGIDAGVTDDIDQNPRPLGTAPDLGADESPYSLAQNGVQASVLSTAPRWKVYYTGANVPPSTYLEQNYLIPYAYYAPAGAQAVTNFSIQDTFPAELTLTGVDNPAGLDYTANGNSLAWISNEPLAPGRWGWVGLTGQSDTASSGQNLTNTGQMSYTLAGGSGDTIQLSANTQVPTRPVFAPLLITPLDGEMCLETGNQLSAKGVAGAGMTVRLYEDDVLKAETVASPTTGEFSLNWTSGLSDTHAIVVYTRACEPGSGACSLPSRSVHLEYPQGDWCPQRSYWEGDVNGAHHIFYFRNDQGRYASNDFVIPGVYGFSNTRLHLYSCCDQNDVNPFRVNADGIIYQNSSAHDGRWWTFEIGAAHIVTVESQCQGIGGTKPKKTTQGVVLIDPDGFIFNATLGGAYDAQTGMFAPVQALAGMTITAYEFVPEWQAWIPWPAHLYGQINPQVTGTSGYFAFFTPPGKYFLQVEAGNGYQSWSSPVITVVSELVHVNVPLTFLPSGPARRVTLTSDGPQPPVINVPVGSSVEWFSTLKENGTAEELLEFNDNPVLQPHTSSPLDPLTNPLGFDGGMLKPGQFFTRQFTTPGDYPYTDGLGHTGTVKVYNFVYVPIVKR